jgi:hypothetical protein
MSRPEIGVFALLLGSTGLGIYQMATSPWGRPAEDTPPPPTVQLMTAPGPVLTEQKIATTVDDGVTEVNFGEPSQR